MPLFRGTYRQCYDKLCERRAASGRDRNVNERQRSVQAIVHKEFYNFLQFLFIMYSQNREEAIITQLFGQAVGHFLDIGAYDGKTFSNTLRLTELGWSGVCIEPSPTVFPALLKLHAANPKISLVNSALGAANAFVDFYDSGGDAISTTHEAHRDKWVKGHTVTYSKMTVFAVTYGDLFRKFGSKFDFINLDVEGVSAELFMLLPLQMLESTRCLCVEHDGKMQEIQQRASQFGFDYVWHSGENVILFR